LLYIVIVIVSFHEHIRLKFKEDVSIVLHLDHTFLWS